MSLETKEIFIEDDTALGLADTVGFQTVERHEKETDQFVDDIYDDIDDKQPVYRNPYIRIGIAIGGIAFVLGFASIFSGNKQTTVVETVDTPQEEESLTLSLEGDPAEQSTSERSEVDRLRSEVALLDQQIALAQIDRTNSAFEPTAQSDSAQNSAVTVENKPSASATRPATSPTTRTVSTQPTPARAATRPVTLSPARITARTPVSSRAPASAPAPRPAVVQPTIVPERVEPQEQWFEIANAGVVGSMPPMEVEEVTQPVESPAARSSEFSLRNVDFRSNALVRQVSAPNEGSIPGLFSPNFSFIPFGSAAKAEIVTPITWLSDGDQFAIEVLEDIHDSAGEVSIPRGAFVIAQAVDVDESSGFGRLVAVGLQISNEIIPVDHRAVSIKGAGGDPLIAEQYGNVGDEIANNDMEMFLVGALSGIGRELIKPNSQTITNGSFGSTVTTDNSDRNILGAVLAGGTEQLASRMSARNDERLNDIRAREVIWYLPEGHEVQIYFNEDVQL